jgi:hypothetical protein
LSQRDGARFAADTVTRSPPAGTPEDGVRLATKV